MSTVQVIDRGSGMFRIAVAFTRDDCDRLPFNALCRIRAQIEALPQGGANAHADFNLRDPAEAGRFVETLAVFGEKGLFATGGAAAPSTNGG